MTPPEKQPILLRCPACDGVLGPHPEQPEPVYHCQSCGRTLLYEPDTRKQDSAEVRRGRVIEIGVRDIARRVHRAVKRRRGLNDPLLRAYLTSYLLIVMGGVLLIFGTILAGTP